MDQAAEERFALWMTSRGPALQRFAYLLCGDWQVAEDLVQEAFVRCAMKWDRIETFESPDGYVRAAVVNQCRMHWRRRKARPDLTVEVPETATDDATSEFAERAEIVDALRALPVRQRATVVCRYYEGMSEAETAAVLGCSIGTVKSQTHRALSTLRVVIGEEGRHAD